MPVEDWLTAWSGRRTFERFWLPLLAREAGRKLSRVVGRLHLGHHPATVRGAAHRAEEGDVRLRAGRLRANPRALRRDAPRESVERRACAAPVASIEADGASVRVREQDGTNHVFDDVVVTTNTSLAARIITGLDDAERASLRGDSVPGNRLRLAVARAASLALLPDLHYRRGPVHRRRRDVEPGRSPSFRGSLARVPSEVLRMR